MSEINNWLAETNDAVTTLFGCLSCNRDRLSTRVAFQIPLVFPTLPLDFPRCLSRRVQFPWTWVPGDQKRSNPSQGCLQDCSSVPCSHLLIFSPWHLQGYNVGNHKKPFDSSWSTSDKSNVSQESSSSRDLVSSVEETFAQAWQRADPGPLVAGLRCWDQLQG
jgi:hypothetical protein